MLGITDMWRLLSGQAEREAAQRNLDAHKKARQCYGLDDHLDEIDRLMSFDFGGERAENPTGPTGTNGASHTSRKQNGWE